ncbi:MAG: acyl-CoA dehydrogenase family protein [Actinomycetota bacterium]|nr:acyl-CoA dehydrogenase family protein [Actinomycetota bacterium]
MSDYTPPLRDIKFVLRHIADLDEIIEYPGFEHVDPETIDGALDEAGRFMAEVVAPTNRAGDEIGATWADGSVTTPDAFKDAWTKYVDAGWSAVTGPPEYGGHGFPETVGFAVSEMFVSANLAFSLNPMLTGSAITVIRDHADDELRATYLEKLITAEWTGTMVLTETEAGSDVGALRTKATPNDDGTYLINGSKIFITWGDHDLSDNIIHLVLARLPDAPPGTRGISLFIVPKMLVNDDGTVGASNNVETVSIEHKLGIHGSPTCVQAYDNSIGYLVGEPNRGMGYMFAMMNQARREVGLEGLGISDRAYQQAVEYAKERTQGRAIGTPKTEVSPIIEHPDVRRMLMTMKAYNEAARALLYDTAASGERMHRHPDEAGRRAGSDRVALLTPVAKAWCTDIGVEMTSIGVQVHGGMGYVEETGAAQHYRDARITPIYEGTNGIQAIDLVMRKLPMDDGSVVRSYLDEMAALTGPLNESGDPRLSAMCGALAANVEALREATEWLLTCEDPNDRLAGATPYLRMFGVVAGGYYLARLALAAAAAEPDPWFEAKIDTASFYAEQLLPTASGLLPSVKAGAGGLFSIPVEGLETAK